MKNDLLKPLPEFTLIEFLKIYSERSSSEREKLDILYSERKFVFSINDLLNACLSGTENPIKKLFWIAKETPKFKSTLPDINTKDQNNNTLLLNLLIIFHRNMRHYVDNVSLITDDPDCTSIPFMFANQLSKLQKLSRMIKYLFCINADETIENDNGLSPKKIMEQIKQLSETVHPNGKKHFVPIKNLFLEIDYSRKKERTHENMLFSRAIQLPENNSNQPSVPKTQLAHT